jgi:hypothetical protein
VAVVLLGIGSYMLLKVLSIKRSKPLLISLGVSVLSVLGAIFFPFYITAIVHPFYSFVYSGMGRYLSSVLSFSYCCRSCCRRF